MGGLLFIGLIAFLLFYIAIADSKHSYYCQKDEEAWNDFVWGRKPYYDKTWFNKKFWNKG